MGHTDSSIDDMDKKLLLSIQSECNAEGVTIPWNNIAELVGPNITGSAVIQHLAKLRIRMFPSSLHDIHPGKKIGDWSLISYRHGSARPQCSTTP